MEKMISFEVSIIQGKNRKLEADGTYLGIPGETIHTEKVRAEGSATTDDFLAHFARFFKRSAFKEPAEKWVNLMLLVDDDHMDVPLNEASLERLGKGALVIRPDLLKPRFSFKRSLRAVRKAVRKVHADLQPPRPKHRIETVR